MIRTLISKIPPQTKCLSTFNTQMSLNKKSQLGIRHYTNSLHVVTNSLTGSSNFGIGMSLTGTSVLATFAWASTRYKVATAGEYLVKTGILIDDIDISKQTFWFPYQTLDRIKLEPTTYHVVVKEVMSSENISFDLPAVFTIGPKDNNVYLKLYAKFLLNSTPDKLNAKIMGILTGETRLAAGATSLEDLFNNRIVFKENIIDKINIELAKFGCVIYNANLEEVKDADQQDYFKNRRKRALEGASNKAKVDVAEHIASGNIGEKEHVTKTRQRVAEFETQAILIENEKAQQNAESIMNLTIAQTEFNKQMKIKQYEADANAEKKKLELQKDVEIFRNIQKIEALRADQLSQAGVTAEVAVRKSEGIASALIKEAEGKANALKLEFAGKAESIKLEAVGKAEAIKLEAAAEAVSITLKAEANAKATELESYANYIKQQQEAKGILELRFAEAEGLNKLMTSAGGSDELNKYLIVKNNILQQMAAEQAKGLQGMKPIVTVNTWDTNGQNGKEGKGFSGTMSDLLKTGIPLFSNIKDQTGYDFLKGFKVDEKKSSSL